MHRTRRRNNWALWTVPRLALALVLPSAVGCNSHSEDRSARYRQQVVAAQKALEDSLASILADRRDDVLNYARELSRADSVDRAFRFIEQFRFSGDSAVLLLSDSIRELDLLAQIRRLPAEESLASHARLYEELRALRPDVDAYARRYAYYADAEREKRLRESRTETVTSSVRYIQAGGNLWTGVRLYYGPNKTEVGEVLGGNDRYVDPITGRRFRGLKLRMASGRTEWKDRQAVITGQWFVRANDPAIGAMQWYVYER